MKANYLLQIAWTGEAVLTAMTVATKLFARKPELPHQQLDIEAQVYLGRERVALEVARSADEWAIGLMGREQLQKDRGMLFWFAGRRSMRFWMRNTLIPLDMIFLRDDQIVEVVHSAAPCRTATCPLYGPVEPISAVLELAGGTAERLNLRSGDKVHIEWFSPEKEVPDGIDEPR